MNLYENKLYQEDVCAVAGLALPWHQLHGKKIMLSGATGMIGSFLIDVIMKKNKDEALDCTVYALSRNSERAKARFSEYVNNPKFIVLTYDAAAPIKFNDLGDVDYVLHLASNTHPLQYSTDPIGTITTNLIGLLNLLQFAAHHHAIRFVFASSNEIYGENRGDTELFKEDYCGYIDSNTLRAGYPESKRCGESLCQAFRKQKGLDVVIPRLTRTYGPTLLKSDTKALSQFIKAGLFEDNIVLKSSGTQYYSYQYVADSVSGILTVLLCGKSGEAYNVAEEHSDIMLKDLAGIVAEQCGKKVIFEIPEAVEAAGYSKATKARLDGSKLAQLGWKPLYNIHSGLERTLRILRNIWGGIRPNKESVYYYQQ